MLIKKLYSPTWTTSKVTDLDPNTLRSRGIKGVLVDLDNTLVAWNIKDSNMVAKRWIDSLKDFGITVIVVSNNNESRVKKAVELFNIPYVSFSLKPLSFGINKALKISHLTKRDVVLVGDQVMTDILAGNLADIKTVLVDPLVETDNWNTRINRFFEKPFLKNIRKSKGISWKIN